jgi:transcriptional regulator with XRE-family HTH domain
MLQTTMLVLRSGEELRKAMDAAGTSNRKLAAKAGIAPSRVGQLTSDENTSASVAIATSIAAALDVDVAQLWSFPDGEALIALGLIREV